MCVCLCVCVYSVFVILCVCMCRVLCLCCVILVNFILYHQLNSTILFDYFFLPPAHMQHKMQYSMVSLFHYISFSFLSLHYFFLLTLFSYQVHHLYWASYHSLTLSLSSSLTPCFPKASCYLVNLCQSLPPPKYYSLL